MIEIVNDPEFIREVKKGDIELTGEWFVDHYRDGEKIYSGYEGKNLITLVGLNYLLDTALYSSNRGTVTQWYVGLIGANIVPSTNDVATDVLGSGRSYGELQTSGGYDNPTTRALFVPGVAVDNVISNILSKAEFTMSGSVRVYGGFLVSTSNKSSNSGTLFAARRFDNYRDVIDDDVLAVTYQITATSS